MNSWARQEKEVMPNHAFTLTSHKKAVAVGLADALR